MNDNLKWENRTELVVLQNTLLALYHRLRLPSYVTSPITILALLSIILA
jgi:hypothetical protein